MYFCNSQRKLHPEMTPSGILVIFRMGDGSEVEKWKETLA
jgi:hypothetical protein